jgi:hypothetical protein
MKISRQIKMWDTQIEINNTIKEILKEQDRRIEALEKRSEKIEKELAKIKRILYRRVYDEQAVKILDV